MLAMRELVRGTIVASLQTREGHRAAMAQVMVKRRVLSADWQMQLFFALAGVIFVLCQIVVVGTRTNDAPSTLARDAGYEDGTATWGISPDTD